MRRRAARAKSNKENIVQKFLSNRKLIVVAIVILVIGVVLLLNYYKKPYSSELEARIDAELEQVKLNQTRPDYLPAAMFKELPAFPKDFYQMRVLVRYGRITDLSNIGEEYWKQPEWYPEFESIGVPLLQNPPKNRWAAQGYGVYPADSVATTTSGEEFDLYTYVRSSYLVETYQGMQLIAVYPDSGTLEEMASFSDGTKSVTQDPNTVKNYFDVSIEPNMFVLEPSFPIFKDGYAQRIKVSLKVKPGTPKGKYLIGVDIAAPSQDKVTEWTWQYKNLYTSAGTTKVGRPWYRVFVDVK